MEDYWINVSVTKYVVTTLHPIIASLNYCYLFSVIQCLGNGSPRFKPVRSQFFQLGFHYDNINSGGHFVKSSDKITAQQLDYVILLGSTIHYFNELVQKFLMFSE
jgi:hypothetical protein